MLERRVIREKSDYAEALFDIAQRRHDEPPRVAIFVCAEGILRDGRVRHAAVIQLHEFSLELFPVVGRNILAPDAHLMFDVVPRCRQPPVPFSIGATVGEHLHHAKVDAQLQQFLSVSASHGSRPQLACRAVPTHRQFIEIERHHNSTRTAFRTHIDPLALLLHYITTTNKVATLRPDEPHLLGHANLAQPKNSDDHAPTGDSPQVTLRGGWTDNVYNTAQANVHVDICVHVSLGFSGRGLGGGAS